MSETSSSLQMMMSRTEAERVTTRIKSLVESIATTTEKIMVLIEQAKAGQAWRALGYPSWTAYVSAEFSAALKQLDRAERVPVVQALSSTGMSTRAIASVVGKSVGTVHNDQVFNSEHLVDPALPFACGQSKCWHEPVCPRVPKEEKVTGTDGKTYLRNGRPTAEAMEALAKDVPAPKAKVRKRPIPDAYFDLAWKALKNAESLERLHHDDRFSRNREAVARKYGPELARAANLLCDLLDDLGVDRFRFGYGGGHDEA